MFIDNFPSHEIFTSMKLEFKGIRVLAGELSPADFTLRLELAPMDPDANPNALADTFTKFNYFVDQVLNNSVFIDRMDEWSAFTFVDLDTGLPNCANNLVHVPNAPTNIAIAEVLHAKLASLADPSIHIGFLNLTSSDGGGLGITSVGDPAAELPNMDDWVGGDRSYWSKPWWSRDDASTMDVVPAEDANLAEPPEFAYSLAFLLTPPEEDENAPPKVVRLEFRPRLIQGGKQD
jgi:hypothetical protein